METQNQLAIFNLKYMHLLRSISIADIDQAVLRCPLPRSVIVKLSTLSNSQLDHIIQSPFLHYKVLLPTKDIDLFFRKETLTLWRLKCVNNLLRPSMDDLPKKSSHFEK
ncbi:hypothetical protein [Thorsellia anophelis]|uniref:Uncharacterized protein n=1 Tax=Thorsellia anophelis DSM 18579 TaxID=1123402 RepID=A0A1I0D1U4_9GAMM|nr:hypothetical protein [Thorsellia anophelis]SET25731.1 hypothetical protein SAMN02583745_01809 [Thorsellia anophelis DSM 18579]